MAFNKHSLQIDPAAECERIVRFLQQTVRQRLHRYGGVVGISGGVDSSVVLALCVRAFGVDKVAAIMMPEKDSDPETEHFSRLAAEHCGVEPILEDITPVLEGFGCYPRRDEAIRRLFPEYDAALGYKAKISLPQNLLEQDTLNVFLSPSLRQMEENSAGACRYASTSRSSPPRTSSSARACRCCTTMPSCATML